MARSGRQAWAIPAVGAAGMAASFGLLAAFLVGPAGGARASKVVWVGHSTKPWGDNGGALLPISLTVASSGVAAVVMAVTYVSQCPKTGTRKYPFPSLNANTGIKLDATRKVDGTITFDTGGKANSYSIYFKGSLDPGNATGKVTVTYAESGPSDCRGTTTYDLRTSSSKQARFGGLTKDRSAGTLPVTIVRDDVKHVVSELLIGAGHLCRLTSGKTYVHPTALQFGDLYKLGSSKTAMRLPVDGLGRFSSTGSYTERPVGKSAVNDIKYKLAGRFSGDKVSGTLTLEQSRTFSDGSTDTCAPVTISFSGSGS